MNLLSRVNQFVLLFIDTLRQVGRWRIWLLLLGYFLLQWLVLYGHYRYLFPPFYALLSPWIDLIGGRRTAPFTHYPQHLYHLSWFAGWAKLLVGLIFEGALLGAIAVLFFRSFTEGQAPLDARSGFARWVHLVIAWVVLNGLWLLLGLYLPELARPYLTGPRRVLAFSYVLMPAAFAVVFALLYFAIPRVAVLGENAFVALGRSVVQFFRRPFTAFFLATIILAVPLALSAFNSHPAAIIRDFRPELIYWLLALNLGVEMVASFFWMGTAVRFLIEPEV